MNIFLCYDPDRFACVRIPTQIQINVTKQIQTAIYAPLRWKKLWVSAMGCSWVFRERISETLGNRCCFRMFLFLFPVSVRMPLPSILPSFLWTVPQKKKSRPKKSRVRVSTAFQEPQGDGGWRCAVCAWGSSDCSATPSAGATAGAQPAVVRHTDGPRSFCRWIFCRWWKPKFCRGLDVSGRTAVWAS